MTAYFNDDWPDDHPTWQDVVRQFVRDGRPSAMDQALAELDGLIADDLSEEDLHWLLLTGLSSGMVPDGMGIRNREWLQMLRDELRRQVRAWAVAK